jgi:hypothetical protein
MIKQPCPSRAVSFLDCCMGFWERDNLYMEEFSRNCKNAGGEVPSRGDTLLNYTK